MEKAELAAATDDVLVAAQGALTTFTLNRPRALNALTDGMRAKISATLPDLIRNPNIYAVAFCSASERAFCAGGDIRELSASAKADLALGRQSLADEYSLNWQLDCFTKPSVSLMNGMCVGSGVGLTLYNTHRVAGENYTFAMPETGIGLFPDLGVCHTLARLPDFIGTYLGLTGRSIGPADAYRLGLVTHCIPSAEFPAILEALADAQPVDPLLDARHVLPAESEDGGLEAVRHVIARTFSAPTVEEIVERLDAGAVGTGLDAAFCKETGDELRRRSPTSLKVTLRHLQESKDRDLAQTLEMDHRIASWFLKGEDFHEGVRALLIDKDRNPVWRPAMLTEVTEEMVEQFFAPMCENALKLKARVEMQ